MKTKNDVASNVKLIAAAPELLEALQKIIQFNRQEAKDRYGDSTRADTWSCVRVAEEAIKKATE